MALCRRWGEPPCASRPHGPSSTRSGRATVNEAAKHEATLGRRPFGIGLRFAFVMRCWANQWWKQLRCYEQGALSARDWEKLAREAAQTFSSPGGKRFRDGNRVFEDVYAEIDKYQGSEISDFALRRGSEDDA